MKQNFVHLHVHTEFSLQDSIVRIKDLVRSVARMGMPAVAVTDLANLFAVVKFYKQALANGIKPVIGSDVWIENPEDHNKPYRLVLLCQNIVGYRNLSRLLSRAYIEGQHSGRPCIHPDWLSGSSDGLIVLSGAEAVARRPLGPKVLWRFQIIGVIIIFGIIFLAVTSDILSFMG